MDKIFSRGHLSDNEDYFRRFPKISGGWMSCFRLQNNVSEFVRRCERNPLTVDDFLSVIKRSKIKLVDYKTNISGQAFMVSEPLSWVFLLNKEDLSTHQAFTLVHEVIHIFYQSGTIWSFDYRLMEEEIDKRARKFYDDNKSSVDSVIDNLRPRPKQLELMFS